MCGLVGFFSPSGLGKRDENIAKKMMQAIVHRGPDSFGLWSDESLSLFLAHRRLSIHDLSELGHQPMGSEDGRYTVVFNGEIYNFLELRFELEAIGKSFRGHSDTEVMLACFEHWGVESALEKFVGMFAIALVDKAAKKLYLIRDRMGEKPIYYGWSGNTFFFGSELKSFSHHPSFNKEIDREALSLYFRYNYIPSPYSIYKNIKKLGAGCMAILSLDKPLLRVKTQKYWDPLPCFEKGLTSTNTLSEKNVIDRTRVLLESSIKRQLISDVPLGAFLSGGIDSSLVVAMMQNNSSSCVNTFSIGFNDEKYNEADYAKKVADYLGTRHTELYVDEKQLLSEISGLGSIYDEPFADSSQIPTILVSKLARKNITVSLTGDGGDELFFGYKRYNSAAIRFKKLSRFRRLRNSAPFLDRPWSRSTHEALMSVYPAVVKKKFTYDWYLGLCQQFGQDNVVDYYKSVVSKWRRPTDIVINGSDPQCDFDLARGLDGYGFDPLIFSCLDSLSYLPDDLLTKVDRAGMSVGLETRMPFLDRELVEFAMSLNLKSKAKDGELKWVLKSLLKSYIPDKLVDRPKKGFSVPIARWLRQELKVWAEDMLFGSDLVSSEYINQEEVARVWKAHLSGFQDNSAKLWSVLMFQLWVSSQ